MYVTCILPQFKKGNHSKVLWFKKSRETSRTFRPSHIMLYFNTSLAVIAFTVYSFRWVCCCFPQHCLSVLYHSVWFLEFFFSILYFLLLFCLIAEQNVLSVNYCSFTSDLFSLADIKIFWFSNNLQIDFSHFYNFLGRYHMCCNLCL